MVQMKAEYQQRFKCFWCELSGRYRVTVTLDGGRDIVRYFGTYKEATEWQDKMLEQVYWKSACCAPLYLHEGKELPFDKLPVGALFHSPWDEQFYGANSDGICLCVILPNKGKWCIDSQATNCNAPKETVRNEDGSTYERTVKHRCWVRHGDPRTGNVDVPNEHTLCTQGAGSIGWGRDSDPDYYHGFLRHGFLIPC